jgi:DNA repair exonuclease SbcCD ATPase subunit
VIEVPGDTAEYDVPVTKISSYTIDEIFEKKLYILIPFYIFTYESGFCEYDTNEEKLESLKQEYQNIIDRLNDLTEKGELSSFDKRMIIELADDVMKELTRKYSNIQQEVGELMRGPMIQTEARRLRDEGMERGQAMQIIRMSMKYHINNDEIITELVEELKISTKQAEQYLTQYGS